MDLWIQTMEMLILHNEHVEFWIVVRPTVSQDDLSIVPCKGIKKMRPHQNQYILVTSTIQRDNYCDEKVFYKCMKSWRSNCWWWLVQALTQIVVANRQELSHPCSQGYGGLHFAKCGSTLICWYWIGEWERINFSKLDYGEPTKEGGNNFVCMSFCKHESLGLESDPMRWRWELGFIALCVQRFAMAVEVEVGYPSPKCCWTS
jgi:hypothetical protein